jgi:Tfp pilus assembly protein PilO
MAWLPADPKGRKQAAILMMALIAAAWYSAKTYVVDPRQAALEVSSGELARLADQNERARIIVQRQVGLEERVQLVERQLRIFEELLPTSEDVPALLDAIAHEARMTGVGISRLRPQASEPGGRTQAASSGALASAS